MSNKCTNSDCIICQNEIDFEFPKDLLDNILKGNVVLFAGAGISTEKKYLFPNSFYETIAYEIEHTDLTWPFPKVMTEFCKKIDGRIKLLQKIKERFENINSFSELRASAVRFHRELATIHQIKYIVTTNWDKFFEEECGANPFVTDDDLMFWNVSGRKVIKLHGSIDNLGSVIATEDDYDKCRERLHTGIIGSTLKHLLATKTLIYIGYSLKDEDFNFINSFVQNSMKGLSKQSYIVTIDNTDDERFKNIGLIPIYTDATYFISIIKQHMVHDKQMFDDSVYEYADFLKFLVEAEHVKLNKNLSYFEYPSIVYASTYQDGMIHALERMIERRKTGEYSNKCYLRNSIHLYEGLKKEGLKNRNYEKVSYIEGYLNAMISVSFYGVNREDEMAPPLYYAFGVKEPLYSFEQFKKIVGTLKDYHKSSYQKAKRHVEKTAPNKEEDITFHHPPYL